LHLEERGDRHERLAEPLLEREQARTPTNEEGHAFLLVTHERGPRRAVLRRRYVHDLYFSRRLRKSSSATSIRSMSSRCTVFTSASVAFSSALVNSAMPMRNLSTPGLR